MDAVIAGIAANLGPQLFAYFGEPVLKGLAETLLKPWVERLQAFVGRGYDRQQQEQALAAAIREGIRQAGVAVDDPDPVIAAQISGGLRRLQAHNPALHHMVAGAIIAYADPLAQPPETLRAALAWPKSRTDELRRLLVGVRLHLSRVDQWKDLLAAANEAHTQGQLAELLARAQLWQGINVNIGTAQQVSIGNSNTNVINYFGEQSQPLDAARLYQQVIDYLEQLEDHYRNLNIRGIDDRNQPVRSPRLDLVYMPLQVRYRAPDGEAAPADALGDDPTHRGGEAERVVDLNQAFALGRRVVITGGAGSGKSLLLTYIAWVLAADSLGLCPGLAGEKLGLGAARPLPVYIPIEKYITYCRHKTPPGEKRLQQQPLAEFIHWYFHKQGWTSSAGFADYLLKHEDGIALLLDGLDEISSSADRRLARAAVEQFLAGRKRLWVAVTSRPQAYSDTAVLAHDFIHLEIPPLAPEQVNDLIGRMYAALLKQPHERIKNLLSGIENLEAQRRAHGVEERLIDSPLMARMAFVVHFNNRGLPQRRAALYEAVSKQILAPDYGPDDESQIGLENSLGDLSLEMHQYLAYHMHARGEQAGRIIPRPALEAILRRQPDFAPYIEPLLEQICTRSTLIEAYGDDEFRFFHHSFQEYLAARYIVMYQSPEALVQMLCQRPQELTWWREVVLLVIGACDELRFSLTPAFINALAGLNEPPSPALGETLRARLHSLIMHPQRLQATPRLRAAAADARDRLGHVPEGLYEFVPVPDGERPKFWMARYPVTNRQYARFVDSADFGDPTLWQGFPVFDAQGKSMGNGGWDDAVQEWLKEYAPFEIASDGRQVIYPRRWHDSSFGIVRPNVPVVGVSWFEANAYCRWLQRTWAEREEVMANPGLQPHGLRLPTEPEWLLAAGGDEPDERYTWDASGKATGDETDIIWRCNVFQSRIGRTTPVDLYPDGQSPFRVWDLSGNVWEWQANYYAVDKRDVLGLRGGSWDYNVGYARSAERDGYYPVDHWILIGFRPLLSRP